ncbi:MAG: hypothetical protein ACYS0I_21195 [Planctomycetota bacterium]
MESAEIRYFNPYNQEYPDTEFMAENVKLLLNPKASEKFRVAPGGGRVFIKKGVSAERYSMNILGVGVQGEPQCDAPFFL